MKIVALIPARGGSKSIPFKNIMKLGNHPLIAYSIAEAKLSQYINEVVVTTDSTKIADIARKYRAYVPFLRPKNISRDHSLDVEFFKHYLNYLKRKAFQIPDIIVHLRPTTPLREISVIDCAIQYMVENKKASALRSMHKTHLTPYKMFKKKGEYACAFLKYKNVQESYNLPRQKFDEVYIPNGYVDIVRPSILLKTNLLHGRRMKIWETDNVADIDGIEDYHFAAKLLKERRFNEIRNYLKDYQ
ncbi:MAG: acylneuraminate cytidylyltransferase family protein [Candidatus Omnitrophica bacterium]|nr:acylneuraminate cytidylyltransferase family protein [Candidatus Omnitrophota bacterium]